MNNKIIYICSLLCLFILACSNTTDIDSPIYVNDKDLIKVNISKVPNAAVAASTHRLMMLHLFLRMVVILRLMMRYASIMREMIHSY